MSTSFAAQWLLLEIAGFSAKVDGPKVVGVPGAGSIATRAVYELAAAPSCHRGYGNARPAATRATVCDVTTSRDRGAMAATTKVAFSNSLWMVAPPGATNTHTPGRMMNVTFASAATFVARHVTTNCILSGGWPGTPTGVARLHELWFAQLYVSTYRSES